MQQIILKVDVDTLQGTLHGVPPLLALFKQYNVKASFLFSVGPDNTGRAIRRVFRKGFLQKVGRTSVLSHYGIGTLMNGVLRPGPHIGKKAAPVMRQAAAEGHEVGIHCYDHVRWQDNVAKKGREWTLREMQKALAAYQQALNAKPSTLGAAGWQINSHVLEIEQEMGFEYASDVRGRTPFKPRMDGVTSSCVQCPTTLPTLDEIIGENGVDADNCWQTIADQSQQTLPHGHVYTLHAELEGMRLLPAMEELLKYWQAEGFEFLTLAQLYQSLELSTLPTVEIKWDELPGRSGFLAVQAL